MTHPPEVRTILQLPAFALAALAAASVACAHAPPAAPAQPAAQTAPPSEKAKPQLSAAASKPAAPQAQATGQADLDAALANLREVSVFFPFDESNLTRAAQEKLAIVGDVLRTHPGLTVTVEGNCDERGTGEYNLALGQKRAEAAKQYLVQMGAIDRQVSAVSFGSEKPRATGHDEKDWSQNRRDDVVRK
jgi:peptidoglycan-associated lipoprotein